MEITNGNFEKEILNSDKPVLVDFWASWCAPCRIIAPAVEQLAEELKDKVKVAKSNVDENPELATHFSVLNIPTLILFKGGAEAARMIGINPKEAIRAKIEAIID